MSLNTEMGEATDLDEAGRVFTRPAAYADEPGFHRACAALRAAAPVHRVEAEGFKPFWALTGHREVLEVSRRSDRWLNAPRPALGPKSSDEQRSGAGMPIRTLVQMDPPDHTAYRRITSDWFRPGSLRRLDARLAELARRSVDRMAELGDRCDFVTDIAVHYPLQVILAILGLPESDYPRMLQLTQELFGTADPELARDRDPGALQRTLLEFVDYFQELTRSRRAEPTDDLASVIANAQLDGRPIGDLEAIGYYVIIATAGHDTTAATIAGGLHALLQHPDQLALLQRRPELVNTAAEEMIRWVSPVKQFMRTATADTELAGVTIPAGGSVLLSYPSANRDEAVFDRPDRFDAGRDPNPHLAFGFGAHHCLGAQLARIEIRAFYRELLGRLRSVEPDGDPAYTATLFVGGPKHLPIRYQVD